MRTYTPKASEIQRAWHVIDAEGMVLGRVCTEAARILRGKHKPIFAPHIDTGDHVVIINADKVVLTSGKADAKEVVRYSGYPGGLKRESYAHLLARKPADAVRQLGAGHAPEGPPRAPAAEEAEGLRRAHPPARRPAAAAARAGARQGPLREENR